MKIEDAQVVTENLPNEEVTPAKQETPNIVKMKGLNGELYNQVISYLNTKPHQEVRGLIDSLSSAPILDVPVINAPQGN